MYRGVWGEGTRRESRAMKKNTRFGQEAVQSRWIANEWANLVHIAACGVTVPPPAELLHDGYTMAFIGDGEVAAPRLAQVDLDASTAERVWREIVDELRVLIAADRVHGDLSAYNILWWRDRAVLIDFSQTVDVLTHPAARELLARDIRSLAPYFERRGIGIELDDVLAEIGADDHRFARQMLSRPLK
jgi:RIO kinase 1